MRMFTERKSVSLAAGAYSFNTQRFSGQMLVHLLVIPTTAGNTYDINLTNEDGDIIYTRTSIVGKLNEADLNIPLLSIVTVAISNATVAADPVVIYLVANNGNQAS